MENVLLPAHVPKFFHSGRRARQSAGSAQEARHPPHGRFHGRVFPGEQQRVAMARAVLFRPSVLLADEPTASLDRSNAQLVTDELVDLARSEGCTLLVVTHEQVLHGRMDRRYRLERGRLLFGLEDDLKSK